MRCFIAVNVDNPLVGPFIDELSELGAGLKTVKPENLHLTLKFLGEVSEEKSSGVQKAMHEALDGFDAFETTLYGTGAFPSMNYMRVVWIGMEKNRERVIEMQKAIDENLAPLGFELEKKFHPHLTLARVKSQKGKGRLKAFLARNREREFGNLMVDAVHLKKSVLTPKGPIYSTVNEVKLEGG
jgi:2'-5' RNA ligase